MSKEAMKHQQRRTGGRMNNDIRNLTKWLNEEQETPIDRQALARVLAMAQQQEPVVFYRCNGCGHAYEQVHPTSCDCMEAGGFDRVEYYTYPPAQRTWVGLTDEEMDDCWNKLFGTGNYNRRNVYRAIEAKLREKNT